MHVAIEGDFAAQSCTVLVQAHQQATAATKPCVIKHCRSLREQQIVPGQLWLERGSRYCHSVDADIVDSSQAAALCVQSQRVTLRTNGDTTAQYTVTYLYETRAKPALLSGP
eukprot:19385-Heterococcus_DN1.PRE.1